MSKQLAYKILGYEVTDKEIETLAKDHVQLCKAVEELNRALKNGGPLPDPSRTVEKRQRTEWPALWAALDTLRKLV